MYNKSYNGSWCIEMKLQGWMHTEKLSKPWSQLKT